MLKMKEVNIIRNHELEANISWLPNIYQCVNEMDNALSEIDRYDPGTFRRIAEQLVKVI